MSKHRIVPALLVFLCLCLSAGSARAFDDTEPLIDIVEGNREVIAVVRGTKAKPVSLQPREEVLWRDTSGKLAAFLTGSRFLVISTSSRSWHILRLQTDEPDKVTTALLSPSLALLVTDNRAVGYSALSNRFIETRLPVRDELLAVKSGDYVAAVITQSRAFGLAVGATSFTEVRMRPGETVQEVNVTASKVLVHTSDRLLGFTAGASRWSEYRLGLD